MVLLLSILESMDQHLTLLIPHLRSMRVYIIHRQDQQPTDVVIDPTEMIR
jgi:hypothetical protein